MFNKNKNKGNKRILVVDDDSAVLNTLGIVLRDFGYEVSLIDDGTKVVNEISKNPPGLLLLDLIMQLMDGDEILKEIKSNQAMKDIPVIIISASNTIEEVALKHGVNGYLKKPFDLEELYNLVSSNI